MCIRTSITTQILLLLEFKYSDTFLILVVPLVEYFRSPRNCSVGSFGPLGIVTFNLGLNDEVVVVVED